MLQTARKHGEYDPQEGHLARPDPLQQVGHGGSRDLLPQLESDGTVVLLFLLHIRKCTQEVHVRRPCAQTLSSLVGLLRVGGLGLRLAERVVFPSSGRFNLYNPVSGMMTQQKNPRSTFTSDSAAAEQNQRKARVASVWTRSDQFRIKHPTSGSQDTEVSRSSFSRRSVEVQISRRRTLVPLSVPPSLRPLS